MAVARSIASASIRMSSPHGVGERVGGRGDVGARLLVRRAAALHAREEAVDREAEARANPPAPARRRRAPPGIPRSCGRPRRHGRPRLGCRRSSPCPRGPTRAARAGPAPRRAGDPPARPTGRRGSARHFRRSNGSPRRAPSGCRSGRRSSARSRARAAGARAAPTPAGASTRPDRAPRTAGGPPRLRTPAPPRRASDEPLSEQRYHTHPPALHVPGRRDGERAPPPVSPPAAQGRATTGAEA